MQPKRRKNPARRITEDNLGRLIALAGELQMNSRVEKSLNDAIDYLFGCKERLELIEKKEKTNES
ncbi:MAG TPA: hypothetical protein VK536_00650 [Candidatus Limnocylindrales bacterium]|nr:hypothetical protein [Candidatus Limnocylindrales bacterium]